MKIALPGGSGQVGTVLARHFSSGGHEVLVLSRKADATKPWRVLSWDGKTIGPWAAEFEGADAVINLAGSTINTRYTDANRKLILETRLQSTRVVAEAIRLAIGKPRVWMNASAAGIYPHSFDRNFDEASRERGSADAVPETWRFAAKVCEEWERAFAEAEVGAVRKVALRTTLVLSPDKGGVFDVLFGLVRKGLGGAQGSGRQSISWMMDMDYARAVEFLLNYEEISGPVNMAVPEPVANREFMHVLRQVAGAKFGLPAPEIAIKAGAVFLRTEPWLVLKSVRAVPGVLEHAAFDYSYAEWRVAARNLVRRWRAAQG